MFQADNNNNPDPDPIRRRRQQQQQQPQPQQRIFRGQPPRGFRFARRHVHPNNIAGMNVNAGSVGPGVEGNDNPLQNPSLNGNGNANGNGNGNANVQRLRFNMGRGQFIVRQRQQQQQRANPSTPSSHQRQQWQHHHPMGPNGTVQMGPNGPVQVRMVQVQVDPLAPQPVPALTNANTTTNANANANPNATTNFASAEERTEDPPEYERFKCEICYEYLNEPVGCGKCSSRFCRSCLQRVYESDQQKQQATRCPVCRCEYNQMAPDLGIYGGVTGDDAPTLPCRYVSIGCPERTIPLSEIANHETVCEHVPMRCRYAPYGCTWTGKRGLIKSHEEFACKLAPMGQFIEQFRQIKADHTMRLEMVAQQASGSVRMSHILRQTYTRDNQRKSLSDIFRLFQYCHAVTSLTPHFLMTKDLWVSYWRNNESRAAVINFCVCIPFLSASLGVAGHGITSFFDLFDEISPDRTLAVLAKAFEGTNISNSTGKRTATAMIEMLQNSQTEELLENTFLGLCVGILGVVVVMLNFVDTKSNISWDKISLPYLGGKFPLVGDVMAISIFTLLFAIMGYHQLGMRSSVIWMTVVVTSTFFPALILSISHYTARLVTGTPRPTAFNMMEMSRLMEPCMFGLRFSMMIIHFDLVATLDASVVLSLVPQTSRIYLKNSLFDHLPRTACFVFLAAKSAFWAFRVQTLLFGSDELDWTTLKSAVTFESAQRFFTSSPDAVALSTVLDSISTSVLATASLMVTSFVIHNFFALGIAVGDYIALTSQKELSPEGLARGVVKEYSSVGLFAFGSWAMMIALLAYI